MQLLMHWLWLDTPFRSVHAWRLLPGSYTISPEKRIFIGNYKELQLH